MLVRGAWDRLLAPFLEDRTLSQDLAGHTLAWGVGWRGRGGSSFALGSELGGLSRDGLSP